MPRVQCLDCGTSVVVDPSGMCPEGHHVGAAGARIAAALGDERPHPDEPEPWTARVVLDDEPPATLPTPVRQVRPIDIPHSAEETGTEPHASSDELLKELHSLSDSYHEDAADGSAGAAPATAGTDVPPAADGHDAGSPTGASPQPNDGVPAPAAADELDALAELTALEAAVHALGVSHDSADESDEGPPPGPSQPRPDGPSTPVDVAPPPPPPPAPTRGPDPADGPPIDEAGHAAEAVPPRPVVPPGEDTRIDLRNFTASGRPVNAGAGRRRRRFGR